MRFIVILLSIIILIPFLGVALLYNLTNLSLEESIAALALLAAVLVVILDWFKPDHFF
jgi:hypothetical protein